MRHRNKGKILDRKSASRTMMLRNLATSVVLYERVKTTEAKAKAVKPMVERMVTVGKRGGLEARRKLLRFFTHENATKKVLEDIAPRYKERPGGYMRITRLGVRKGDAAKVVQLEFV